MGVLDHSVLFRRVLRAFNSMPFDDQSDELYTNAKEQIQIKIRGKLYEFNFFECNLIRAAKKCWSRGFVSKDSTSQIHLPEKMNHKLRVNF